MRVLYLVTFSLALILFAASSFGGTEYLPLDDEGEMLIIVYDDFYDQILELAEWKEQKGIKTTVVRVSETYNHQVGDGLVPESRDRNNVIEALDFPPVYGQCCYGSVYDPLCDYTTFEECDNLDGYDWNPDISEYQACYVLSTTCQPANNSLGIHNYIVDFHSEHPDLKWILLVGESDKVSTYIEHYYSSGYYLDYASDVYYSKLNPNTDYPEFTVGRFSAHDSDELTTMIERTLTYERDMPLASQIDTDWFHRALLIARADEIDVEGNPIGEGHINLMRNISSILDSPSSPYTQIDSIYERVEDQALWDRAYVASILNNGISVLNYAGHANPGSWQGVAYGIISPLISNLQNQNKLPLVYSIGCETAPIHDYPSGTFGESWLEATDANGDPIGAIATYMNSRVINLTSPGMIESNRLLAFGDNITIGTILYNGSMKLVHYTNQDFEFKSRILFGDPSVVFRSDTPREIVVTGGELFYNDQSYTVTVTDLATSSPIENAKCALYYVPNGGTFEDGTLFGSINTDANGQAVIPIDGELPIDKDIKLTVTGRNLKTSVQDVHVDYELMVFVDQVASTNITTSSYFVKCDVYSNSNLLTDNPVLQYDVGGQWVDIVMTYNEIFGYFYASIPAQGPGTTVLYRVTAENENQNTYTTDTYSFEVYDYHFTVTCLEPVLTMPENVDLWFDVSVKNDGFYTDSYFLSIANNEWPVTLWNGTGQLEINMISSLQPNMTYNMKVQVTVSSSVADEFDQFDINFQSGLDPSNIVTLPLTAVSFGPATPLPLYDEFASTTIDPANWRGWGGTLGIDQVGLSEPSEPYSMHFYRSLIAEGHFGGNGLDWLTSNYINLKDEEGVYLDYEFQRTGGGESPEENDDLVIEYYNNAGQWQTLYRLLGKHADMDVFDDRSHQLPADAYHEKFQIRFKNVIGDLDGGFELYADSWFIDDVRVGHHIQTPNLFSPADGSTITTAYVNLLWSEVLGETLYEIEVDDDINFGSVDRTGQVEDGHTWTVSPGIANGTYYWRVRALIDGEWSPWSSVWQFTRDYHVAPPPSCPVLFTYDGTDFVENNPLLTACELNGYSEDVYDYYLIDKSIKEIDGKVVFQLRELEDEITYLNSIELLTVDHLPDVNIGCSVDGQIFNYNSIIKPLTAVDNFGVDCLGEINNQDEIYFNRDKAGSLTLTFELNQVADKRFGMTFASGDKQLCPIERKETVDGKPSSPLVVEYLDSNNEWKTVSDVPPRVLDKDEIVFPDFSDISGLDKLTLRLTWDDGYSTDYINLIIPDESNIEIRNSKIVQDKLMIENVENEQLNNSRVKVLNKGDIYEFVYNLPELEQGVERTYIIKAHGKYMPTNYTGELPNSFVLRNNYPNPFNPTTTIEYQIPYKTKVMIEIFNVLGQKVSTLVNDYQEAGNYSVEFNSTGLSSGVYLYRLKTDDAIITKKMVLLK